MEMSDDALIRLANLKALGYGAADLVRLVGSSYAYWHDLLGGKKSFGEKAARNIEDKLELPRGCLDLSEGCGVKTPEIKNKKVVAIGAHSRQKNRPQEHVISQFETGGGMNHGGLVLEDQPGVIKSWHVDDEWLRLNVKSHTGVGNLCIVTGFGPSMRPMFNPGDPLLVDRGVTTVEGDAVYFFRVGNAGYVKLLQRIPDLVGGGQLIKAISKNGDFLPFDILPDNPHFQVLGKVLTVWKSEQF